MYRTVNNGELRKNHIDQKVTMCGWIQKSRDLGGMTFVDLRDVCFILRHSFDFFDILLPLHHFS